MVSCGAANTCTWNGNAGDGDLSNPLNWDVAPVSGNGDTLVFPQVEGGYSVSNGVAGISVAKIQTGGTETYSTPGIIRIGGGGIVLTGTTFIENYADTVIDAPITVDRQGRGDAATGTATLQIRNSYTFNGPITLRGAVEMDVKGKRYTPDNANKQTVTNTFNGPITGPNASVKISAANSCTCYNHFHGRLTLARFSNGMSYGGSATYIRASSNEVADVVGAYQTLHVFAADAFPGADLFFDGYYRENGVIFDFKAGLQQMFDGFDSTNKLWSAHILEKNCLNSDRVNLDGTAETTLRLCGTRDHVTECKFEAKPINLVWAPTGNFTHDFSDRIHLNTGTITVEGGTFRVSGTNVFKSVPSVDVRANATLEVATTNSASIAFPALMDLKLGAGARLRLTNAGATPFTSDKVGAILGAGAKFEIPAGVTVALDLLSVDGVGVEPGTYTKANVAWIEGEGAVSVRSIGAWAGEAGVYTWSGAAGNGLWNDAANWTVGEGQTTSFVPSRVDDEAWIPCDTDLRIDVEDGASVGRVRFTGGGTVTLDGSRLSVLADTLTPWSNDCAVVCNVSLTLAGSQDASTAISSATVFSGKSVTFNGAISSPSVANLIFHNPRTTTNAVIRFNAPIVASNATVRLDATRSEMVVAAPVTAKAYATSTMGPGTGTVRFLAPLTLLNGSLTLCYRTIKCGTAGVLNPSIHIDWTGWWESGRLDLDGFDQTCDYLTGTYLTSNGYAPTDGSDAGRSACSSEPATLTVRASRSATAPLYLGGQLSLVYDPLDPSFEQTLTKRASDTSGTITVKGGTLRLDDGASCRRLSGLLVEEGARFELRSQVAGALCQLTRLELGTNASFTVAAGGGSPISDGRVDCVLSTGAQLDLPEDCELRLKSLTVDGQPVAPGWYASGSVPWLTGGGRLHVPDGEPELEPYVIDVPAGAGALTNALAMVAVRREIDVSHPIVLKLAPGRHPLASGLVLNAASTRADWPTLTLAAADPAHKPRLEAGTEVTGWTKEGFGGRGDVWSATVPAASLPDPCRVFLFNATWMEPARWPNHKRHHPYTSGYARAKMPDGLPKGIGGSSVDAYEVYRDEIVAEEKNRVLGWSNPLEGWVRVSYRHNWNDVGYRIREIASDGTIRLDTDHVKPESLYYVWDHWCVYNVREELDAPGEWYYDRTAGKIHFIPPNGENPNEGTTVIGNFDTAVLIQDSNGLKGGNVRLENLEICGVSQAVSIQTDGVVVRGCALHDSGFAKGMGSLYGGVVAIYGHRVDVSDNDIWNAGGSGIQVTGFSKENKVDDRLEITLENNYIHHCGLLSIGATGVSIGGQGVAVRHNLIHDCARSGIGWGGRFNEVAWNRIRNVATMSDDTSGIYGGSWVNGVGVQIHHNYISDCYGYHCNAQNEYVFNALCSGIYPDEGSGGLAIYCNVIRNCHQGAMHLHNGRWITISNNVFISNSELPVTDRKYQLSLTSWNNSPTGVFVRDRRARYSEDWEKLVAADPRWLEYPAIAQDPRDDAKVYSPDGGTMMGVQVVNNVFSYPDQGVVRAANGNSLSTLTNRFDRNVYWPGPGAEPFFYAQNAQRFDWAAWQAAGEDVHSVVADPCFEDLANGDLRLRNDSPARALGIEELHPEEAGLVTNDFRRTLPVEAEGVREHPEWLVPKSGPTGGCLLIFRDH